MPGVSGVTVVTTLVRVFCCARGCGCIGHPAFPAPSIVRSGETVFAKLGRIAPRDRGGATSLRGATRRSNPFFHLRGAMDCFAALAMTVSRHAPHSQLSSPGLPPLLKLLRARE